MTGIDFPRSPRPGRCSTNSIPSPTALRSTGPAEPECDEPTEPAAPDTTTDDTTTESE